MLVTLPGIVRLVRLVQFWKTQSPKLVTLLGIVTLVRLVQAENAPSPMLVTLPGIVTRSGWCRNGTPSPRCW